MTSLLDRVIQLVQEHGSAAALRDHLAFVSEHEQRALAERDALRAQMSALSHQLATRNDAHASLQAEYSDLQQKHLDLQAENRRLKSQVRHLEETLTLPHPSNPDNRVCDHCASMDMRRIGTREDPTFGAVGLRRAVYACNACGKESSFELPFGN